MDLFEKLKLLKKKKNKITFFFPSTNPRTSPPMSPPLPNLGIGYIATVLENNGYEVRCVDGNVICPDIGTEDQHLEKTVLEKALREVERTKPDILGVGSWTVNFPFAAELVTNFAEKNPDILIVLGGYQATFLPEFVLKLLPQIDILVLGEGEFTMLELMNALENGMSLDKVKGIVFKRGKQIIETPARNLMQDLNDLPFVNYDLFVGFNPQNEPGLMILTSRGCPHNCIFCSCKAFWHKIRTRSVENVIGEIKHLRDKYKIKSFGICDDLFSVNKERVFKFCEILNKEKICIPWSFDARIDSLDEAVIHVLLQNGVYNIFCGLESVNIDTLRYIGEKNPGKYVKTAIKLLNLCLTHDVPCMFSTIVGFPNETEEEMKYMLNFVNTLKSKGIHIYTGLPICYPGTRLWDKYKRKEISLVKIEDDNLRRNSSGFFSKKYEHFPECVPNAWMMENSHVDTYKIEQMLRGYR